MRAAVVTGGSRGIGRAVCAAFAGQGVHVVFGYAGNEAAAQETAALCERAARESGTDSQVLAIRADVSEDAGARTLIDAALTVFGRVDILVNNAGITRDGLLFSAKEKDFDDVLATNLKGAFLCCRAAVRPMMKQRFGRIVNISSVVGVHGNAGQSVYAASKAGLIGMTKSIARELTGRGITANCVAPGFIETDMTGALTEAVRERILQGIPQNRIGSPEDVAGAVLFLASDAAGYITGQVLGVDGGQGM
ncbi:3-oxoacyl-[acyl-carrier-protein] reductase [Lachnoclostridium sp. Marseille-P6806]|uniref:3-oxoacyl-[acyl-carrier-protein] reductase n=1 Tax=Lachnoclostridium sp. Marseille-P6806 TaxID=2364793 RepID=UPI001F5EA624|nr:3-oxoacyl-[acyl-carrier-protein] reductase [Lachnoclostridium sp. Marseille-P6806]